MSTAASVVPCASSSAASCGERRSSRSCEGVATRISSLGAMPEALIIIDFQNDFTPGGALEVPEGDEIAEHVNRLAAVPRFDLVVATRDWHPPDHGSFTERGGPWPLHCVQDTEGAELYPALDRARVDI